MIRLQTATLEDTKNIARLVNSAYRGDYSKNGWTTEADHLDGQRTDHESLFELIKDPLQQIELLYEGKSLNLLGSVLIVQEPPETLYFGMLTIEPTMQGRGYGKMLLDHVERVASGYGFKKLRMTVISTRKEIIDYYIRRGFKETGKYEDFPKDPKYGIPKIKDIKLQEFEKILS